MGLNQGVSVSGAGCGKMRGRDRGPDRGFGGG